MAYFSSGTEWINFSKHYCERCANWRDRFDTKGTGCPIDDIHMEEIPSPEGILAYLIPEEDEKQCSMFLER